MKDEIMDDLALQRIAYSKLRSEKEQLLAALRAACAVAEGHVYFRTANGIFMEMPRKTERIIKAALRAQSYGHRR